MYDQLLPVPFGGLDGSSSRAWDGPRFWRDTHQSVPVELAQIGAEPLSLEDAKRHLLIDLNSTDDDPWLQVTIPAVRRLVEADTNRALPLTQYEFTFDQFPRERWIPIPKPPLVSIDLVSSVDLLTNVESTFDPSKYFADTYSQPGRLVLLITKIWPVAVRWQSGGKIRWTAGYAATPQAVQSITASGGVATVTMAAPHGFASGRQVAMAGADQLAYNGTFTVVVTGAATFQYPIVGAPASPATGTITAAGITVPSRYVHAMKLMLGHWFANREAVVSGTTRHSPEEYPMGYEALIADRLVSVG